MIQERLTQNSGSDSNCKKLWKQCGQKKCFVCFPVCARMLHGWGHCVTSCAKKPRSRRFSLCYKCSIRVVVLWCWQSVQKLVCCKQENTTDLKLLLFASHQNLDLQLQARPHLGTCNWTTTPEACLNWDNCMHGDLFDFCSCTKRFNGSRIFEKNILKSSYRNFGQDDSGWISFDCENDDSNSKPNRSNSVLHAIALVFVKTQTTT